MARQVDDTILQSAVKVRYHVFDGNGCICYNVRHSSLNPGASISDYLVRDGLVVMRSRNENLTICISSLYYVYGMGSRRSAQLTSLCVLKATSQYFGFLLAITMACFRTSPLGPYAINTIGLHSDYFRVNVLGMGVDIVAAMPDPNAPS